MLNLHHFVITPKYRRPLLQSEQAARAAEAGIRHIARLYRIDIHRIAIQPDHVHIFADLPRDCSVARAMMLIKWYSSIVVRKAVPALKQANPKALWGQRYFHCSVGVERRSVESYIERQVRSWHEGS